MAAKKFKGDPTTENKFVHWFREHEEKDGKTKVDRFFQHKSSYGEGTIFKCYGQTALFVAHDYFHTEHVLKYVGPVKQRLAYCTVTGVRMKTILSELIIRQKHKAEIYRKVDGNWKLFKTATPGKLGAVEELLGGSTGDGNPLVMAVLVGKDKDGNREVGLATVDQTSGLLGVAQFKDSGNYTVLESVLVSHDVRECMIYDDRNMKVDIKKITDLLDRSNIPVLREKYNKFDHSSVIQDLNNIIELRQGAKMALEFKDEQWIKENKRSSRTVAALVIYMDLLQGRQYKLKYINPDAYMKLDTSATVALNLFPAITDTNSDMCLLGVLDKCRTGMGSRLLKRWIQQPLVDPDEINARLDVVELLYKDTDCRMNLHDDYLRKIPDLDKIARKMSSSHLKLEDLVILYHYTQGLESTSVALQNMVAKDASKAEAFRKQYTEPCLEMRTAWTNFNNLVEAVVDLRHYYNERKVRVQSSFDPALQKCLEAKNELKVRMVRILDKWAKHLSLNKTRKKDLSLECSKSYGWHLRATKKAAPAIRKSKLQYQQLSHKKGAGSLITTSALQELSVEYKAYEKRYDELSEEVKRKAVEVAMTFYPLVEKGSKIFGELDVFVSFANIAENGPREYVRPNILPRGTGVLQLKEARHPCLERQDDVNFQPNDVDMRTGESNFQIITGPNTGGKSTYIRQVGVICLMAQIGSFVPCSTATISCVDRILARVGAGDNQLQGVSTFMAEMIEASSIVQSATENSLVIIDELGRGTSTSDGFGLAWAIAQYMAENVNCQCMFATHFHELTRMEATLANVKNKHVAVSTAGGKITMKYKIETGACEKSYGITVAKIARFPESVVTMAVNKAQELESAGSAAGSIGAECRQEVEKFMSDFAHADVNKQAGEYHARLNALTTRYPNLCSILG